MVWYSWGMSNSPVALRDNGPRAQYVFRKRDCTSKSGTFNAREDVEPEHLEAMWLATIRVAATFPDIVSYIEWVEDQDAARRAYDGPAAVGGAQT